MVFFSDWLDERNPVICSFIRGISGHTTSLLPLAKTVEQMYVTRDPKFVSPMAFSQNLLSYYVCGSKTAIQFSSKGSPAGSYSTILNWISDHSQEPLKCPASGDVVTFFDNNQVYLDQSKMRLNCIGHIIMMSKKKF